ncbi:MAG: hypothetical protein UT60_C0052G0005, partial [candidate division CPR2 bacterium GW2011_GWD2_39_7]
EGYKVLERNFKNRFGEIDIVARDGNIFCFIEVKWRRNDRFGSGLEAVGYRKQQKIIRMVKEYLKEKGAELPVRIDVVSICGDTGDIQLLKNAVVDN